MAVRGAPAIGVAAAYGVAFSHAERPRGTPARTVRNRARDCWRRRGRRPSTSSRRSRGWPRGSPRSAGSAADEIEAALVAEADAIAAEDIARCRRIGELGAALLADGATVLTHCNAGALATAGYGTALGVIRGAIEAGKPIRVLAGRDAARSSRARG